MLSWKYKSSQGYGFQGVIEIIQGYVKAGFHVTLKFVGICAFFI